MTHPLNQRFLESLGKGDFFHRFLEALPDIYVFMKDRNGRFVMANERFLVKLGYNCEEDILGLDDFAVFKRNLAEGFRRDDEAVFQGKSQSNKVEIIPGKDGKIDWYHTTKLPLTDEAGQCIGLVGITRDLRLASDSLQPYLSLEPVIRHLLNHYADPIQTADMAKIAGLTPVQFTRRFKREFQMPPMRYLILVRINAACRLLSSTLTPISDISLETGFYDHSFFTKQFIRYKGVTPRNYRKDLGRSLTPTPTNTSKTI
jgi:PAS domain S-box-containing protein